MDSPVLTAIRCPNDRPHGKYELCGRLLCAVKDGRFFVYCEMCKQFFEMVVEDNDNVSLQTISKETRLELKTRLRVLH